MHCRYNSDTKQRALESLFEAANTSESDRLGPNELYTFLQNPDISGKAGTEMASMFGMLPKSFFATMFQTIDTDFGTGNGLGGGLDKQGFAEAFSDMFDENGNYYIPTDAVGSQLRALFAEYTELIREVDETKFGHERDIQQQRHELKQSQVEILDLGLVLKHCSRRSPARTGAWYVLLGDSDCAVTVTML